MWERVFSVLAVLLLAYWWYQGVVWRRRFLDSQLVRMQLAALVSAHYLDGTNRERFAKAYEERLPGYCINTWKPSLVYQPQVGVFVCQGFVDEVHTVRLDGARLMVGRDDAAGDRLHCPPFGFAQHLRFAGFLRRLQCAWPWHIPEHPQGASIEGALG